MLLIVLFVLRYPSLLLRVYLVLVTKMSHHAEYSADLRKVIVDMHARGLNGNKIAKQTNLPPRTVQDILKKHRERGTAEVQKRSGRPAKLSVREKRLVIIKSKENNRRAAPWLTDRVNETRPQDSVSVRTVQRVLTAGGLCTRSQALPEAADQAEQQEGESEAYLNWTVRQWKNVLWTDESKFELFSDGTSYIRRPVNTRNSSSNLVPTVKHGDGSVMVHSCFIGGKVGPPFRIEGIMKKEEYVEILDKTVLPWAFANCPVGWSFQQGNDPKHSSNYAKDYFARKNLKVMQWPSQSPDLNPIEYLWEVCTRSGRSTAQGEECPAQVRDIDGSLAEDPSRDPDQSDRVNA